MSAAYHGTGGSAAGSGPEPRSGNRSRSDSEFEELGQITGELLHDLGGILAVLSGRVALAREEASLGRIPDDELRRIQGDTDELRRMVVEILEELKRRPRSLEVTFPVGSTIDETVNRWLVGAPSVNTTLRSTLSPRAEIAGPRSFFSRAVGNLLRNAARHARGEIRITVRPDPSRESAQIRIEDDGEGVSPEVREQIFDPFVSAADTGTGLGLSFARWGVERLGGNLQLVREPTDLGGAAFLITVPLATFPRQRQEASSDDSSASGTGRARPDASRTLTGLRVAIVDDDSAVRRTLARLLERSGAEAVEIDPAPWRSSAEACEQLVASDADVVLLDVNLHRVSGPQVAERIRRDRPELTHRLLFMTGGTPPPELSDHPMVSKIVGWDELTSRILQVAAHASDDG